MFWKNFVSLCNSRNISPSAVCKEIGLSNATATHWKKGATPGDVALAKVSLYFGVTKEQLLSTPADPYDPREVAAIMAGHPLKEKYGIAIPNPSNEAKKPTPATISSSDLTPEEQLILLRYCSASDEIKLAVRKILDVPTGKEELVAVYHAAHTDDGAEDKIIYRTKEEIAAMENAPESDIDI